MSLGQDAAKIRINAWASISWTINAQLADLGFTGVPQVKIAGKWVDKLTAQTGEVALGASYGGADIEIMTPLLQPNLELIRAMMPWAQAQGSFLLLPPSLGVDLYDYAALLNLHPLSAGAGTNEDINMAKAVPTGALELTRDGAGHDVLPMTWRVFPDRAQLPALIMGYVGPLPGA